jgi:DNA-binding NtrC family response regulator
VREAVSDLDLTVELTVARNAKTARSVLHSGSTDVVLLDLNLPGESGLELLATLRHDHVSTGVPVAVVTGSDSEESRRACEALGVVAFFSKGPYLSLTQFLDNVFGTLAVQPAAPEYEDEEGLHQGLRGRRVIAVPGTMVEIIGETPVMRRVMEQVEAAVQTDAAVLLQGEIGTGRELLAHYIHQRSHGSCRSGDLVKISCAMLPSARHRSNGNGADLSGQSGHGGPAAWLEAAAGGILLLDEVGALSPESQTQLLGALHEPGERRAPRILSTTRMDLVGAVDAGTFRRDLYYRLAGFPIHVPPLRERLADLPQLVGNFLERLGIEFGRRFEGVTDESMQRMQEYAWPGNVKELANALERAALISDDGGHLEVHCVPGEGSDEGSLTAEQQTLDASMSRHIVKILDEAAWVIEGPRGAARRLGLKPSTLRSKHKRLGIARKRPQA